MLASDAKSRARAIRASPESWSLQLKRRDDRSSRAVPEGGSPPGMGRISRSVERDRQQWIMDEIFREEASDGASGQQLLGAFVAEIAALYPGWTPTTGPSADPADFVPPRGRFIVAYTGAEPVACGGLKPLDRGAAEIKRLYVRPDMRGRGLGRRVLGELERVALTLGYTAVRLDTGGQQPDAVRLFEAADYQEIPDYNGNPFANRWFEKSLK